MPLRRASLFAPLVGSLFICLLAAQTPATPASIAGTITDEKGQPLPGMTVRVHEVLAGTRTSAPREATVTDHRGTYRLNGLDAGEYLVEALSTVPAGLSVFHPGESAPNRARTVTVARSQALTGVDIRFSPRRLARISGTVVTAANQPLSYQTIDASGGRHYGHVSLFYAPRISVIQFRPRDARLSDGGRFEFDGVEPGEYVLRASVQGSCSLQRPDGGRAGTADAKAAVVSAGGACVVDEEFVDRTITVESEDIGPIRLSTAPTGRLKGRIVFEGQAPRPALLQGPYDEVARDTENIEIVMADGAATLEARVRDGSEADAAFMVSEALKRLSAKRRHHARTEAETILEPGTAAQFRQHWIHLAGVPLILLSADEAMAAWNARKRLLGILRIERDAGSVTIHIGTRMENEASATPYRFTAVSGGWQISELPPSATVSHDYTPLIIRRPSGGPISN